MPSISTEIDRDSEFELSPRVRYRTIDGEGVLVHLDTGRVVVVNSVGLHLVKQLENPRNYDTLLHSVVVEFDVSPEQAKSDLQNFLAELDTEQLLNVAPVNVEGRG